MDIINVDSLKVLSILSTCPICSVFIFYLLQNPNYGPMAL